MLKVHFKSSSMQLNWCVHLLGQNKIENDVRDVQE